MIQAESKTMFLVNAVHAGQKFLRVHSAVECLAWRQAIVAAIAWRFCKFFSEIAQQRRSPAFTRFRVVDHLAQLLMRDLLFALTFFFDEALLFYDITCAEEQHALARQAISTRAPGLLIITLDVLRQIVMHHKTHVRFVDAHPERDRRSDHSDIVTQKCFLIFY